MQKIDKYTTTSKYKDKNKLKNVCTRTFDIDLKRILYNHNQFILL